MQNNILFFLKNPRMRLILSHVVYYFTIAIYVNTCVFYYTEYYSHAEGSYTRTLIFLMGMFISFFGFKYVNQWINNYLWSPLGVNHSDLNPSFSSIMLPMIDFWYWLSKNKNFTKEYGYYYTLCRPLDMILMLCIVLVLKIVIAPAIDNPNFALFIAIYIFDFHVRLPLIIAAWDKLGEKRVIA